MPEDKKESTVDFLNGLTENKEVFKEEEPKEEEVVVEEEEDDKPLPFHKDPKIQRYIEKQVSKAVESIRPSEAERFREEVKDINLPPSFVKLVGNDTEEKVQVLKDLSSYFSTLKGDARKEFLAEMQEQEKQATEEDQKAVSELYAGFESIEEEHNVDLTSNSAQAQRTQEAFKEYLRKISPKDANGEVTAFADIPAAWESFSQTNKPRSASRAKELASRGLARSTDADGSVPQGKSWKDVDRFFAKLKVGT